MKYEEKPEEYEVDIVEYVDVEPLETSAVGIGAYPNAVAEATVGDEEIVDDFESEEEAMRAFDNLENDIGKGLKNECYEAIMKALEAEIEKQGISQGAWNPPKTKKGREELLKKCGRSAFLLPDQLKFPVKDNDCRYNINGVRAAIRRAAQHGYRQVLERAQRLLERLKKKLGIDKSIGGETMSEEIKKENAPQEEQKVEEQKQEQQVEEKKEEQQEEKSMDTKMLLKEIESLKKELEELKSKQFVELKEEVAKEVEKQVSPEPKGLVEDVVKKEEVEEEVDVEKSREEIIRALINDPEFIKFFKPY